MTSGWHFDSWAHVSKFASWSSEDWELCFKCRLKSCTKTGPGGRWPRSSWGSWAQHHPGAPRGSWLNSHLVPNAVTPSHRFGHCISPTGHSGQPAAHNATSRQKLPYTKCNWGIYSLPLLGGSKQRRVIEQHTPQSTPNPHSSTSCAWKSEGDGTDTRR